MKAQVAKVLLLMFGFSLLVAELGFLSSTPAPAAPNSARVTVVNTASQPVPTVAQGTTAISGNVGISGTPSVSLVPGTKINVANVPDANGNPTPLVVRDHTPTQPFHIAMCADIGTQSGSCQKVSPPANSTFQVPTTTSDGQAVERMVIENVSGYCYSVGQQVFEVALYTVLSENSPNPSIPDLFPASASASSLVQTVSQQTRLYADPGSGLVLAFGTTGTTANGTRCGMVLTGYLTTKTP